MDLSVVIPAKNEQDNIAPLVSEIELALSTLPPKYEIIYVDDGSTDATAQVIKELAVINILVDKARLFIPALIKRRENLLLPWMPMAKTTPQIFLPC